MTVAWELLAWAVGCWIAALVAVKVADRHKPREEDRAIFFVAVFAVVWAVFVSVLCPIAILVNRLAPSTTKEVLTWLGAFASAGVLVGVSTFVYWRYFKPERSTA